MKLTVRQATLIAQDIWSKIKDSVSTLTTAEKKELESFNSVMNRIKKEEDKISKQQDILRKEKEEALHEFNKKHKCQINTYYGAGDISKQAETILSSIGRPTLSKVMDTVELTALKTEHKDMDKFIAEILKQFK